MRPDPPLGAILLVFGLFLLVPGLAGAADGSALYAENCAKCHGADGLANTPVAKAMKVPPLADPKWAAEDSTETFVAAFRANPKHGPLASKVSDDDLRAIAAYVRGLASPE